MTVQLNILIWTVICFCAFMLILWRLLLKPLLDFMDARKARIAHARTLDKSAERAAKLAQMEAEREAALRARAEEHKAAAQALREEARAAMDAQALEFKREAKRRREELAAEEVALVPELAVSLNPHVEAFTEKLAAFGER